MMSYVDLLKMNMNIKYSPGDAQRVPYVLLSVIWGAIEDLAPVRSSE